MRSTPSIWSITAATAFGTSDLQSPPSRMRLLTSVPEKASRLYMGESRTSYPYSWKRRRVTGLLVYTTEKGGLIETTWGTHSP